MRSNKGFSLIEFLIALTIIGIFAAVIVGSRGGEDIKELLGTDAAESMATDSKVPETPPGKIGLAQDWHPTWEYHRMKTPDGSAVTASTLNELGTEGWELISVFPLGGEIDYIFKRMKQ